MLQPASTALRWLYCLSIVSIIFPSMSSGWVNIALGRGPANWFQMTLWIVFVIVGIWRIFQVATEPRTLQSYVYEGPLKVARMVGIVGMVLCVVYLAFRLGYRPLVRTLFPKPSENGVEYFVVGVYLAMIGILAPVGLYLFEFTRLVGFERHGRGDD